MTTFQSIVYGIVQGFSEFLPISVGAHQILLPYVADWPEPSGAFLGALSLGTFLAVIIYFRHDWASMVSSFLQLFIYRKRPMTMDEWLLFFILLTSLPVCVAAYYLNNSVYEQFSKPLWIAGGLIILSFPLWISDSLNRRTKGMVNINWIDALAIGLFQLLFFIPSGGRMFGAICGALFRNYQREAAIKYAFFSAAPVLAASTVFYLKNVQFQSPEPMPGLSWLSFAVTIVVTSLTSLLAIGGLFKHIQRKGFGEYIAYRFILAIGIGVLFWFRSYQR